MNTTQFTACLQHVARGMIASEPRLTALDQSLAMAITVLALSAALPLCRRYFPRLNFLPPISVTACCKAARG